MEGGSKQINSGRTTWRSPRDTKLYSFLIENRTTKGNSYCLSGHEFQQLKQQARRTPPGMHPAIQVDYEQHGLELITVELRTFHEILTELERSRNVS